jgi:hypothetical protein
MRPAKTTVTSVIRVEVRVPTAVGFERVSQRRGESVSVCLVRLEPQQRPLRRLLLDAGVDALELPDDERHTFNHCAESKALSNDRTADHREKSCARDALSERQVSRNAPRARKPPALRRADCDGRAWQGKEQNEALHQRLVALDRYPARTLRVGERPGSP